MRHQRLYHLWMIFLLILVGVLGMSGAVFAKDAVKAAVNPISGPSLLMAEHGTGYTPGTYAVGTIVLNYTVVGTTFTAGDLARFNLDLSVYDAGGNREPTYPVTLALDDLGSPNLTLSPSSSTVEVTGLTWSDSVLVTVSVPQEVALDPTLNVDGATLVGNLRLSAPQEKFLDTVPNVQVKITLVHPTACLKVYNFFTDTSFATMLTSIDVGVNLNNNKITSTTPGSLSDNILIANICGTSETFDLELLLDPAFSTQPANNPGNAVFAFSTSSEVDPDTFNFGLFSTRTKQGQNLCLQNITVLPGTTYLATVHFAIDKDKTALDLPGGGTASGTFTGFGAALTAAGSGCAGSLIPATPNPLTISLPFTLK